MSTRGPPPAAADLEVLVLYAALSPLKPSCARDTSDLPRRDPAAATLATKEVAVVERRRARFDVVLTDLALPGMDGVEFTRKIRERRRVPVIALTGFPEVYVTTEEFDAYLEKPVDVDRLCEVI